jgi:predicted NBD/HSP70 family sugar kinase
MYDVAMRVDLLRTPGTEPRDRVVLALRQTGELSRAEIARMTGLAKSTVSETVAELIDSGLVVKTMTVRKASRTGRPGTGVTLNPHAGMCVGLDFGFRHVRGVVADVSHRILATHEVHVGRDYLPEAGFAAAKELVGDLLEQAEISAERVLGIGLAIPGPVDPVNHTVIGTSMIPSWAGVDVRAAVDGSFDTTVLVDNESNCAALAELLWGAGSGSSNMAYLKLHSGVGGALVRDGQIVHGIAGTAGEFGHITLDPAGPLCRCGGRGCLETYVGIPMLLEQMSASHGETTLVQLLELARHGDPAAHRVLADAAEIAGRALAIVATVSAPADVIVGGALAEAGELLLTPLRVSFAKHAVLTRRSPNRDQQPRIVAGALGRDASSLGAVALVLSRLGLGTPVTQ